MRSKSETQYPIINKKMKRMLEVQRCKNIKIAIQTDGKSMKLKNVNTLTSSIFLSASSHYRCYHYNDYNYKIYKFDNNRKDFREFLNADSSTLILIWEANTEFHILTP